MEDVTDETHFQRTPLACYQTRELSHLKRPEFRETPEQHQDEDVELGIGETTSHILEDVSARDVSVPAGSAWCYKVANNRVKAQVVQRDDALLTPSEVKQHWKQVAEAMDKELRAWVKLGCVS